MTQERGTELERLAREDYEEARKNVSGRPKWDDLNPDDPYDAGMIEQAYKRAHGRLDAILQAELGPRGVGHDN